ncbi:hypothetical protein LTR66_013023 [Elasticomyces elasticus]|nr:hypothetical protein LTR66_013023 [Elasticomyces elasticus]
MELVRDTQQREEQGTHKADNSGRRSASFRLNVRRNTAGHLTRHMFSFWARPTPSAVHHTDTASTARPVLVRAYSHRTGDGQQQVDPHSSAHITGDEPSLPPAEAYSFASILRAVDGPGFQHAIGSISATCAKSRMSLASEHASHLQPQEEIAARPQRPGLDITLSSVPEGSSSSEREALVRSHEHILRPVAARLSSDGLGLVDQTANSRMATVNPCRHASISAIPGLAAPEATSRPITQAANSIRVGDAELYSRATIRYQRSYLLTGPTSSPVVSARPVGTSAGDIDARACLLSILHPEA